MKGRGWNFLSLVIWASSAAVLASNLAVPAAVFAAVLGALLGVLLARRLCDSALRLPIIWLGGMLGFAAVWTMAGFIRDGDLLASLLGSSVAYTVADCLFWFFLTALVTLVLRTSSLRMPAMLALEVATTGSIFAGVFAAHREGFINRPFFLIDPLWAQGYDPLPIFLAIGAVVAALMVILTASQRSHKQSALDLFILLGLVAAIFFFLPVQKLKDLQSLRQAQGTKDEVKDRPQESRGGGRAGDGPGDPGKKQNEGQTPQDWKNLQFSDSSQGGSNLAVAVVLLHKDVDPPAGAYYFRQTVFSQYNGQRLVRDTSGKADQDVADQFPTDPINLPGVMTSAAFYEPVETTVALLTNHSRPFGLINADEMTSAPNPDPKRFQRAYHVRSELLDKDLGKLLGHEAGDASWDADTLKHYTDPPSDPRYRQLADQIIGTLKPELRDDPLARAAAVKYWLEKNGTYSLTSSYENSTDPVGDFLFGDRTGYCVFFAHSAVYLFRTLGVPARVGAGYAVQSRDRAGGSSILIRERDSHAWPEIYLRDVGWVVVDIAPEKSLVPPEDPPDQDMQQMMGDMARQGPGNPKDEQNPIAHGDLQEMMRDFFAALARAFWPVFGIFVLLMYSVKAWRRIVPYFCEPRRLPVLAYRGALDSLADAGRVRRFGQTREDFARKSADCPSLSTLTDLHQQATLGKKGERAPKDAYLSLYRSISMEVANHVPFFKRFLGLLNPISWWKVK